MAKASLFVASTIVGVATPTTAGAYYWTQETILDRLSEYVILDLDNSSRDESLKDIWKTLKENLKKREVKNTKLNELKSKEDDLEGGELKKWCFEKYEEVYWSWFREENKDLAKDVKEACGISIGERLDSKKFIIPNSEVSTNEEKMKERIRKLKEHKTNQIRLERKLEEIKNSEKPEDKWKDLEDWCKRSYEKGYKGDKTNRWKLVELYCKQD